MKEALAAAELLLGAAGLTLQAIGAAKRNPAPERLGQGLVLMVAVLNVMIQFGG